MAYHSSVVFLLFLSFAIRFLNNQHVAIAATTKRVSAVTPIPLPGLISNRIGIDDIPEECMDQDYCTIKPTDYPEEQFNNLFKGMKKLHLPSLVTVPTLDNRVGGTGEDDCDSRVKFDPIYRLRTKRNSEWMAVVQAPDYGYEQRIRLEICNRPSAPCFNMFPPTPDTTVYCKQKYSRWEMLVLNGTTMIPIAVDLPTCCSCVYQTVPL